MGNHAVLSDHIFPALDGLFKISIFFTCDKHYQTWQKGVITYKHTLSW